MAAAQLLAGARSGRVPVESSRLLRLCFFPVIQHEPDALVHYTGHVSSGAGLLIGRLWTSALPARVVLETFAGARSCSWTGISGEGGDVPGGAPVDRHLSLETAQGRFGTPPLPHRTGLL